MFFRSAGKTRFPKDQFSVSSPDSALVMPQQLSPLWTL